MSRRSRAQGALAFILTLVCGLCAAAIAPETLTQLTGSSSEKVGAIAKLVESADARALPILQALHDGTLHAGTDGRLLIVGNKAALDAASGKALERFPTDTKKIAINNRVRHDLETGLAALKLAAPERGVRLAAARELQSGVDEQMLPWLDRALAKEADLEIKSALLVARAMIMMKSPDAGARLTAANGLGESGSPAARTLLDAMLAKDAAGVYAEPDAKVRAAAQTALKRVEAGVARSELIGNAFSGLSLGSVLLLAALGLAITFGLMGIINMAHGEFLMIGAYATYMVQELFKRFRPELFEWYLLAAVPIAFCVAALVGMLLERTVIRFLYGRPLETLLATWGASLMLIQFVRSIFGAQNVQVANPAWLSGGLSVGAGVVLPYNRMAIIVFALGVVLLVWVLLNRTRLGLFVRAVTQNRTMADCVGVPTGRIDLWAFGLGCGIAGLGGVALSQIGNVGPELGQNYIVDSFMVVVLGGVGQLAGTIIAALGLGQVNKFLEPYAGAVMAKISILVFIIIFIQKRPQGLFAMRGRSAEGLA